MPYVSYFLLLLTQQGVWVLDPLDSVTCLFFRDSGTATPLNLGVRSSSTFSSFAVQIERAFGTASEIKTCTQTHVHKLMTV